MTTYTNTTCINRIAQNHKMYIDRHRNVHNF